MQLYFVTILIACSLFTIIYFFLSNKRYVAVYRLVTTLNNKLPLKKYALSYENDRKNGAISAAWPDYNGYFAIKELLFALVFIILLFVLDSSITIAIFAGITASFLPDLKRREMVGRRRDSIKAEIVPFIDMLSMMIESGVSLLMALKRYVEYSSKTVLSGEVAMLSVDLEAGLTKKEAFASFSRRLSSEEITEWVSTILHAEKTGSPVALAMRQLSGRLRTERIQKAEKAAYEAPVKLLGPLALFIFPVIFIVLLGPIILRFVYGE